jgi:hypothetical protein
VTHVDWSGVAEVVPEERLAYLEVVEYSPTDYSGEIIGIQATGWPDRADVIDLQTGSGGYRPDDANRSSKGEARFLARRGAESS